jgi:hypothetical protein
MTLHWHVLADVDLQGGFRLVWRGNRVVVTIVRTVLAGYAKNLVLFVQRAQGVTQVPLRDIGQCFGYVREEELEKDFFIWVGGTVSFGFFREMRQTDPRQDPFFQILSYSS